jgi:hypothetical protein
MTGHNVPCSIPGTRKNIDSLRGVPTVLYVFVNELDNLSQKIFDMDIRISKPIQINEYAKIIDKILDKGKYGTLSNAAEIYDPDLFPTKDNILSYAVLLPRISNPGSLEYKGRIIKRNRFVETTN